MVRSREKSAQPTAGLPVVKEWVMAAEAAEILGVTRQYIHNSVDKFKTAHRLSNFLVIKRSEVEKLAKERAEAKDE